MRVVLSKNTKKDYAYRCEKWYAFSNTRKGFKWRSKKKLQDTLCKYIDELGKRDTAPVSVRKVIAALQRELPVDIWTMELKHKLAQYEHKHGRPAKRANPIDVDTLIVLIESARTLRDKTLMAVGWAGALRSCELSAIKRSDLKRTKSGYELLIPRSKTDQVAKGAIIALPYYSLQYMTICPARLLDEYLQRQTDLFEPTDGDYLIWPMRSRQVGRIIDSARKRANLAQKYTSHSLRRGLATEAARNYVDDRTIMRHGRWSTREMIDIYVAEGTLWSRTALDFLR